MSNPESQSQGLSSQNMTITERILMACLVAMGVTFLALIIFFSSSESLITDSFSQVAQEQSEALVATIAKLRRDDAKLTKASQVAFQASKQRGLFIRNDRVLLSSLNNDSWKVGAAVSVDSQELSQWLGSQGNRSLRQGTNLLWFRKSEKLEGIIATLHPIQPTLASFHAAKLRVLLIVALGFGFCSALVVWVSRREVSRPLEVLGGVLGGLARDGDLRSAETGLQRFRESWSLGDRHEVSALQGSVQDLTRSMQDIANQASALAADNLNSELLDREARGDLPRGFARTVAFLRHLSKALDAIAKGDFKIQPSEDLKASGSLGQSFFRMKEGLEVLFNHLSQASTHLEESARGLQESSSYQAQTAAKQADGVVETMATMEELAASSGHIADTAKHVVEIAEQTLENARVGQDAVKDVGDGMEDIVKASLKGAERLLNLDEKSRSIGRVATLIAGVAEQSKILALNAAIEAAHAGEAGRGFSVVAEEVRNLADSVFESTREIEDLITEIQGEIRQAVKASEEEVKRANLGRGLAQGAQNAIVSIFDSAEKMTQAAHQIELATNQQRSASGQVANAVREVAASSEEVAKGARTVRKSLDDLSHLAQDLQDIVTHFKSSQNGVTLKAGGVAVKAAPALETAENDGDETNGQRPM